jgi:flagellar M-ring protein FliF
VHVEYELGTSEDTQETYDPKTTTTLTEEHAEESSTGAAPGGVPGTASNVPSGTPTPAVAPTAEQSTSKSGASTFAVSKTLHHSVEPPGRVHRIDAAVVVDDVVETTEEAGKRSTTRRKRTPEEMKQIEQLAQAAIGVNPQRGDVLAVENLSFQEAPVETLPPPPARSERVRRLIEPWAWALRYLGLAALFLVVYWLVLRPVKKQALAAFRALPGKMAGQLAPATAGLGEAASGASAGSLEDGGKRASQLKRMLAEKVKAEPEAASRLVQNWVQQDEQP